MSDWRKYFPLNATPREGQVRAIESILEEFDKGVQTYVMSAPTGAGKSAIAVTIARYLSSRYDPIANVKNTASDQNYDNGAFFLTTQKILQEQYLRDFENEENGGMVEIKSSTNYECGWDSSQSCGESKRALTALGKNADGTNWKRHCMSNCVYNIAKRNFVEGLLGITNYSYMMNEVVYVGKLSPRELLVCDEAHGINEEISRFIEIEITDRFCKKHLGINLSSYDDPEKLIIWMKEKYKPACSKMSKQVQQSLSMFKDRDGVGGDEMFKSLVKQNDMLDKHICKITRFIERFNANAWVVNRDKRQDHRGSKVSLQFKPIDAVEWTEEYLLKFGKKRLLMSATILNKQSFCKSIGLDTKSTGYIDLPSTFPVENRPVYYMPSGKMSAKEIDQSLPNLVTTVKELLNAHKADKGVIHTSNFRVAKYLYDSIKDSRLLIHNSDDREKILRQHQESKQPTVIISPSITEGVDFIDDLSRFQIIAKLPYPSLNDKALKKRITRDPWYYDYLTARSFIQSLGRGVRHEKDHCVTYVTDSCFESFLSKNRNTIPSYILDAINMG